MRGIAYLAEWIPRLTGIAGIAMGVFVGYNALRLISCDDDGQIGLYKTRIRSGITGAIVLVALTAVLAFVGTRFFGVSAGSLIFLS
jgi:hypothetical protein